MSQRQEARGGEERRGRGRAQRTAQKTRVLGLRFLQLHRMATTIAMMMTTTTSDLYLYLHTWVLSSRQRLEFLEREKQQRQAVEVRDVKSLYELSRSTPFRTRRNQRSLNTTSGCWCLQRPSSIAFSRMRKTHTGANRGSY